MTRWDVCWADVKFEESGEYKRRPVLIINNSIACILAFKMTHIQRDSIFEYPLQDWKAANLNEPTIVRLLKKIKFKPSEKLVYIGKLSKIDIDNIKKILKEHNISLTESTKSIVDEITLAGGREAYIIELEDELKDLTNYRNWLDTQGIKEIKKGGQFDSIEDLNETIEDIELRIDEIDKKLSFVRNRRQK